MNPNDDEERAELNLLFSKLTDANKEKLMSDLLRLAASQEEI